MKRMIIIGASSGIGKELAILYAREGNLVGITGRRQSLLQEIQGFYPDHIVTTSFDVTGEGNQQHLQQLIAKLGGLDLFIYNSGFGDPSETLDIETEIRTTKTNVNGAVELAAYVFNYFCQKGKGQLALTSSVAALRGNSWAPAYSASKAFLSNYAEGLNIKAGKLKKNIVVTDIRPGFINTKMAKGNGRFWVASPQKAAVQIKKAIEQKKRVAYITRRWWIIGQLMKWIPYFIYRRVA